MSSTEGGPISSLGLENAVGKGKVNFFGGTTVDILKFNGTGHVSTVQGKDIDTQVTTYVEYDKKEREEILEDDDDYKEEEEEIWRISMTS